jgi:rod shape-determining protein MreD
MKPFHFYLLVFFAVILQVAFFPEWTWKDMHFEILLVIPVFMGIRFGWHSGIQSGIVFGFAQDVFNTTPFGLSVLLYGIAGFLASTFEMVIFTNHWSTRLGILFLLSLVTGMAALCIRNLLQTGVHVFAFTAFFEWNLLSLCFLNVLFAIPLYFFLEKITSRYDDL